MYFVCVPASGAYHTHYPTFSLKVRVRHLARKVTHFPFVSLLGILLLSYRPWRYRFKVVRLKKVAKVKKGKENEILLYLPIQTFLSVSITSVTSRFLAFLCVD